MTSQKKKMLRAEENKMATHAMAFLALLAFSALF
jgi:hypothetical protein